MGSLEGKIAIVTGAARGIGRAIALDLAREGARVALNYRTREAEARAVAEQIAALSQRKGGAGQQAAQKVAMVGGGTTASQVTSPQDEAVLLVPADVSDPEQARAMVEQVVARWGRLDILVNNAGITRDRTLRKLAPEDWVAVVNNNLNSVFYCTSAAIPQMIAQNYGRIINISSLNGQIASVGQANYSAAKAGIIGFTRTAAQELARFNITVNVVSPGFTDTDMFANVPAAIQDQIKARIPFGRFAKPEEIAEAVTFLAAHGDYITGHSLNVNGGLLMQ